MKHLADAPKKPTNLSVNSKLLAEAKNLNINLSATLEKALFTEVRDAKSRQWKEENRKAIRNCNELAEKNGLFSDKHRLF
jgi:antitoxin CcdA